MTTDEYQAAAGDLLDRGRQEADPRLARAHVHALLATRAPRKPRPGLAEHLRRPRNPGR